MFFKSIRRQRHICTTTWYINVQDANRPKKNIQRLQMPDDFNSDRGQKIYDS